MAARGEEPSPVARRQALVVVLALAVIAALIIVNLVFSTSNTDSSINGRTVTSSQFIDGGSPTEFGGS